MTGLGHVASDSPWSREQKMSSLVWGSQARDSGPSGQGLNVAGAGHTKP